MTDHQNAGRTPSQATSTEYELTKLAAEINAAHACYEKACRRAVACAHHAGALLLAAKAKVDYGNWLPWLEKNFDGDVRTAQRYMRLASQLLARVVTPETGAL